MEKLKRIFTDLLVGWILFSVIGVLPVKMSCPLPVYMHSFTSGLPDTGYTREYALGRLAEKASVNTGVFDSLHLFNNNNRSQKAYFDYGKNAYCIAAMDGSYVLNEETWESEYYSALTGNVVINVEDYTYMYDSKLIATRRGTKIILPNLIEEDGYGRVSAAAKLLEKQRNEKISPDELAELLCLCSDKGARLIGWYPDSCTAIFEAHAGEVVVCNSLSLEMTVYEGFDYTYTTAVSKEDIIGWSNQRGAVVKRNLTTGYEQTLIKADEVKQLNFTYFNNSLVVGGLYDNHTAFIYYTASNSLKSYPLGDNFTANRFLFGEDTFAVISLDNESSFKHAALKGV